MCLGQISVKEERREADQIGGDKGGLQEHISVTMLQCYCLSRLAHTAFF